MLETRPGASGDAPVDLHLHSTCSDGRLEPRAVIDAAADAGLSLVALTDHDTLEGLAEARARAEELGLAFLDGVEISVGLPLGGERHLLAYGFDVDDESLARLLEENRGARRRRLDEILAVLAAEGVPVDVDSCLRQAAGDSVGRPHVADALVAAGHVGSRREAFDRYLADDKPAAVRKQNVGAARAIEAVHRAGGVAVLAHPGRGGDPKATEQLVRLGLDGIEAIHPSHSSSDETKVRAAARRHGLVATGGSDNHGDEDGIAAMRARRVPASHAAALLARIATRRRERTRGDAARRPA